MMTGVCGHQARILSNPLNLGFLKICKKFKSLKFWAYCPISPPIYAFARNLCFGSRRKRESLAKHVMSLWCWMDIIVAQNQGDFMSHCF